MFRPRWLLLQHNLPAKYNPRRAAALGFDEPNVMHYGIAIGRSQLLEFAEKVGAKVYYFYRPTEVCIMSTRRRVVEALGKMCDWPNFKIKSATVAVRHDMKMVVSLYTNYELEKHILSREDESRIAKQVQEAFGLNDEFRPMWFFGQGQWGPGMPE